MPEDKVNIMKYWPLLVGVLMVAGTWASIKSHMSNDTIHLNPGENTLTDAELKNFSKFATQVEQKLPEIEERTNNNREKLIILDKSFGEFTVKFDFLYEEHESLEGKVSRNYVELRKEISNE